MFFLAIIIASLAFTAGVLRLERATPRPHGTPMCGRCAYSLIGLVGTRDRCPECGTAFDEVPMAWSASKPDWPALCTGCGLMFGALIALAIGIVLLG